MFRKILGPAERSLVGELRDQRNKWAHQQTFSGDHTYRSLVRPLADGEPDAGAILARPTTSKGDPGKGFTAMRS